MDGSGRGALAVDATQGEGARGFGVPPAALIGTLIYTAGSSFLLGGIGAAGRAIGLSEVAAGALLSGGSLAALVVAPAWGFAADRWGLRPLTLLAMIMVAAAPAAMALAFGTAATLGITLVFAVLLAARMVQAAFGAALLPVTQTYVARLTAPDRRINGMGLMGAAMSLGTVSGSALLWLVAPMGMSVGFSIVAALGAAAFVFAAYRLPDVAPAPAAPSAQREAMPLGRIWPSLAITLVGYAAYTMVQPLIGLRLIDRYGLASSTAVGQAGLILTVGSLALVASQSVVAAVRGRWSTPMLLVGGSVAGLVCVLAAIVAPNVVTLGLAIGLVGLAFGVVAPANLTMLSLLTGSRAQGRVGGINAAVRGAGIALGPITGALLYRSGHDLPFYAAAGLIVVMAGLGVVGTRMGGLKTG
jgi:predicted MFS family arabinose efflux permease